MYVAKIRNTPESSIDRFNFNYSITRYLYNWQKIVLHIQQKLPEYGGICLLGAGVVLMLSSLSYTTLPLYPPDLSAEKTLHAAQLTPPGFGAPFGFLAPFGVSSLPMGVIGITVSSMAIVAGYLLIRRHTIYLSTFVIWLIIIEALAESSILGWLIKTRGMTSPLPGSRWGVLSSTWLEHLFGLSGALLLPVFILLLSYGYRRNLRRSAGENPPINFFRFKFKATFR